MHSPLTACMWSSLGCICARKDCWRLPVAADGRPTELVLIHLPAFHLSALLSFSSSLMLLRQLFVIPYTLLVLQEIEELCEEWEPEPLAPPLPEALRNWREPVLSSPAGRLVTANGRSALNFASLNFLGIAGSADAKEAARETIHKYGVGSCGPRGFYGTIDVHLQLEVRACCRDGVVAVGCRTFWCARCGGCARGSAAGGRGARM